MVAGMAGLGAGLPFREFWITEAEGDTRYQLLPSYPSPFKGEQALFCPFSGEAWDTD